MLIGATDASNDYYYYYQRDRSKAGKQNADAITAPEPAGVDGRGRRTGRASSTDEATEAPHDVFGTEPGPPGTP